MASAPGEKRGPGKKGVMERALSGPRKDGRVGRGRQPDSARVRVFNLDALAPAGEIPTRRSALGRRIKLGRRPFEADRHPYLGTGPFPKLILECPGPQW